MGADVMDSQLVYRRPCEHGKVYSHWVVNYAWCNGGSETVLDPDRRLVGFGTVAYLLAWLDGEEE